MYKVSVLIPVFNVEEFLDRCIDSVINQTYQNLEIVIVDDGSSDKSPEKCDDWARKDYRIHVIHKKNGGLSSARNTGIRFATGEFVTHLDSDDWLERNAIELLVTEQMRTGVDVVWGKMMMHNPCGDIVIGEPHYSNKHEWILCYSRLTTGIVMTCCRRLIRRSLLTENNVVAVEGCNYAEDKVQMTQIAYYAKSFSYIDDVVYHYNRLNSDSLTAQDRKGFFNIRAFLQEYGSISWIVSFYEDKERCYYEEVVAAKLLYLKRKMEETIVYSSRKGFNIVIKKIKDSDSTFWHVIGWDSWKRVLYENYYYMKYFPKVKRKVKHFIKKHF